MAQRPGIGTRIPERHVPAFDLILHVPSLAERALFYRERAARHFIGNIQKIKILLQELRVNKQIGKHNDQSLKPLCKLRQSPDILRNAAHGECAKHCFQRDICIDQPAYQSRSHAGQHLITGAHLLPSLHHPDNCAVETFDLRQQGIFELVELQILPNPVIPEQAVVILHHTRCFAEALKNFCFFLCAHGIVPGVSNQSQQEEQHKHARAPWREKNSPDALRAHRLRGESAHRQRNGEHNLCQTSHSHIEIHPI